jgi:hypothetical protein
MADDMLTEFKYPYSELFPTIKHKNIYIALNSQRQIDLEKSLTYVEATEKSIRQVECYEKQGKLGYSIEEMFC